MGLRGLGEVTIKKPRQLSDYVFAGFGANIWPYTDLSLKAGSILVLYRPYKNAISSWSGREDWSFMTGKGRILMYYPFIRSQFSSCVRRQKT